MTPSDSQRSRPSGSPHARRPASAIRAAVGRRGFGRRLISAGLGQGAVPSLSPSTKPGPGRRPERRAGTDVSRSRLPHTSSPNLGQARLQHLAPSCRPLAGQLSRPAAAGPDAEHAPSLRDDSSRPGLVPPRRRWHPPRPRSLATPRPVRKSPLLQIRSATRASPSPRATRPPELRQKQGTVHRDHPAGLRRGAPRPWPAGPRRPPGNAPLIWPSGRRPFPARRRAPLCLRCPATDACRSRSIPDDPAARRASAARPPRARLPRVSQRRVPSAELVQPVVAVDRFQPSWNSAAYFRAARGDPVPAPGDAGSREGFGHPPAALSPSRRFAAPPPLPPHPSFSRPAGVRERTQ